MEPTTVHRHDEPEARFMGLPADSMNLLRIITVGIIPAIRRFIDSNSDMNVLVKARR